MSAISFRKSMGQHILWNRAVARRIVDQAGLDKTDTVLEIGAGTGVLTREIARQAGKVWAVERDPRMIDELKSNLSTVANIAIINNDFLALALKDFAPAAIIGNIPYSITTDIIEKLVNERSDWPRAVLTVQKEYGARLLAKPGTKAYGALTIFVNYYCSVRKGFIIPPSQFVPRPKVQSMVLELTPRPRPPSPVPFDEEAFFSFVRQLFQYRRKKISTTLRRDGNLPPAAASDAIRPLLDRRCEALTLAELIAIYHSTRSLRVE